MVSIYVTLFVKGGHVCLNAVFLVFCRTHPVPLVPQSISALSTGPTTVLVTWMAPTVIFREYTNTYYAVEFVL